ncbi:MULTISPECIES: TerC family protein [Paenibacillus]|uniref:TerC family protein n=1 Tax=Paenibacillus xylanilyticus TaxID=248903 RepID=A0A7Y6BZM4_9BACL|nr:TerC family protein [Paenibacillus xylanilyticus]NUU77897.1 TerC family protein [Paenibacillus xylanilyticus]
MDTLWLLTEILMINLVLSGDNAVVIALASKDLPERQRKQAVWWGAFGAVVLRCVLTFAAVLMLGIPFIQAAGGILLFWIAVKLLLQNEDEVHIREASTTWKAVQTILIADFVMSLDNVLAIAALAEGDLALIVIGIAISIPIVVWGSGLIVGLLKRFPILVFAGSGILAFTAGEMVMSDPKLGQWLGSLAAEAHTLLPVAMAGLVIAVGGAHKFVRRNV